MRLIRGASKTFAMALALAASLSAAGAEAAGICTQLQARLVQLDQMSAGGSSSAAARIYDGPIAQQQKEIQRASNAARQFGCVSGFVLFQSRGRDPRCDNLMSTLDRMRANLGRLISARAQQSAGDPFAIARERSAVLRTMQANRCNSGPTVVDTPRSGSSGGLFASLFGQPRVNTYSTSGGQLDTTSGTYRTVCVRTCDGYYFPISFSTVPSQFSADAETCQQMCPGAEVSLYTYSNPGGDVSQAVSLSGEAYTSLPTAFLYRRQFDKACTCGSPAAAAPQFTEFQSDGGIIDLSGKDSTPAQVAAVPVPDPILRPPLGEDPETVANRAGDLTPRRVTGADTAATDTTADGKKIRIVGPDYYLAQ